MVSLLPLTTFFTCFPLLNELSKGGLGGLVNSWQNCLENAAVSSKQKIKKTEKEFLLLLYRQLCKWSCILE